MLKQPLTVESRLTNVCNPDELCENLVFLIKENFPVLVKGRLGSGKSAIAVQAAHAAGIKPENIFVDDPHLKEVADYLGLPQSVGDKAVFRPIGLMRKILNATEPTVVIFDEIDKATLTQNVVAQMIHGYRVGDFDIPKCVRFIATCNLPDEATGSRTMRTHLLDRYHTVLELRQDAEVWANYLIRKYGKPALMLANFIRFCPQFLVDGQNTELALQIEKTPTARSLEQFYCLYHRLQTTYNLAETEILTHNVFSKTLIGSCGRDFFVEFSAFCQLYEKIPSIREIVANPQGAPIPSQQDMIGPRYAIITMLSNQISSVNANAIFEYLLRPEWNRFRVFRQVFVQNLKSLGSELFVSPQFAAQVATLITA